MVRERVARAAVSAKSPSDLRPRIWLGGEQSAWHVVKGERKRCGEEEKGKEEGRTEGRKKNRTAVNRGVTNSFGAETFLVCVYLRAKAPVKIVMMKLRI